MPDKPIFKSLPTFETERLILHELRLDDAKDMFEYAKDAEIAAFGLWLPQVTLQENIDDLQEALEGYAAGTALDWAVEHRADHKMIGRINLGGYHARDRRADLGHAYNRDYWGKGYATEAAHCVVNFAFDALKLNRVGASVLPDNIGSIRVLEKLGFQRGSVRRQYTTLRGEPEDLYSYSILAHEWRDNPT